MKISVTLNGAKTILEAQPDESLMKVLHDNSCTSVKSGCREGFCGSCTVLLEDKPVASCKIPVGIIKGKNIVTLDYFSNTSEYNAIMEGFSKAGIQLCGYCNAGKIFSAYKILKITKKLSRKEITDLVKHLSPCCVDLETLVNGIIYAVAAYNKKMQRTK